MKLLKITFALLSYLIGLATLLYYFDFFTGYWVPKAINTGNPAGLGQALLIDLGLIALFALQHTVMARRSFKARLQRWVPASLQRSVYILFTCAGLGLLIWWWQPIPLVLYDWRGTTAGAVLLALYYLGWAVGVLSSFEIDHFALFGVRQAVQPHHEGVQHLKKPFFYRVVRHPNYLGWILIHWMTPLLTVGHLLLASGITAYIYLGLFFEERDLLRQFGERYRAYRRETPQLNPLLYPFKRRPAAMKGIRLLAGVGIAVLLYQTVDFAGWAKNELAMMQDDDPGIWREAIADLSARNRPATDSTTVLFVGSSSIRFWDHLQEDLHPLRTIRNGFGGAKIGDVWHYRRELIYDYRPRRLVLFVGTNDISGHARDLSPQALAARYRELIGDIRRQLPRCHVYLLPITPTLSRWAIWPQAKQANALLGELARQTEGVTIVDCTDGFLTKAGKPDWKYFRWDGIHLSRAGYAVWSEALKRHLIPLRPPLPR